MDGHAESALDRVENRGVTSASLVDLVTVGFSKTEGEIHPNQTTARDLILKFGKVSGFNDLAASDITQFGIDGFDNLRCRALVELGRRAGVAGLGDRIRIETADDAVDVLRRHFRWEKKEFFVVILMDAKNAVMRIANVHIGTLTMSPVGPREIYGEAVRDGASAVIVAHNHPSGDPSPSPEDRAVTEKLKHAGELLDIPLLDHFVMGERYAVSVMTGRHIGG